MADKNRHLVVISADAMVDADLEYAFTLPHFKELKERGSFVHSVQSIYPSVTYPAHATMSTGCWPEKTGIWANEQLQPGNVHPDWHWFHDIIRCEDIFDAARKAGLTTAGVFWPVTGNHKSIDYLVDEYWPQGPEDTREACFKRSGTTDQVYDDCVRPYIDSVTIRKHPETDLLVAQIGAAMIRHYQPNLLLMHPADIDGTRHSKGLFGEHVDQSIRDTDMYLGLLMDAAKEADIYDDTDFILMSDHGQMEIVRVMNLNVKLCEAGLIRTDAEGNFADWDAYVKSCGMSAHVYVKNSADEERVLRLLKEMQAEETYGFGEILTRAQARERYHLDGDFAFVLETDGFTSFGDDWKRPLMRPFDRTDYRHGRATHGYMPEKGPQAVFLAAGPHIRQGVEIATGLLVQGAPTMARILGVELPEAQGTAWEEMLL